jgi:hypothetical protein
MQFEESDLVLIRLRPKRFSHVIYKKLHARRGGPFKILEKLKANAILVDLPTESQFSLIFIMKDLTTYHGSTSIYELEDPPSTILQISPTPKIIDSILTY